jgi:transmembrane sensor
MRVVVQSGAVALRRAGSRENGQAALVDTTPLLTLSGGDLARLDTSGVAVLTRGADISSYLAWTKGTLLFDGTPLRDALPQLGRWYDLEIRLADSSLGERHLTASFRDEAAPQMLKLLALSLDLTVEESGRIVTLSPKSRSRRSP